MANRRVKLTGLAYWSKVFAGNRDLKGFEDALIDVGGQTSIDLDVDADNFAKLKQAKSMKKGTASPDNPGLTRVKLTRKWQSPIPDFGGAPSVVKEDGTTWDMDLDGYIGNGSDVQVIVSVYDTKRPSIVGTRLDKVIVVKNKPYEPPVDDDVDDKPAPKAKVVNKDADLEDEIPFD